MQDNRVMRVGAAPVGKNQYRFCVWAPNVESVRLHLIAPDDRTIDMTHEANGYYQTLVDNIGPGACYKYQLAEGRERPDPASYYQPEGVHGPSQIVDSRFAWKDDNWHGIPLRNYVIYEMHIGTFSVEGTFDSAIPHLDELALMGITAIEIMPVAQFPGKRNWGYDGVDLFAVQNSYGGPAGLKRFVSACHRRKLAVILDVVYNHFGPEGNYWQEFGPYLTDRYKTPWGSAVNLDGPHSHEVRAFFIQNALYWLREFHIDALRLDATHAYIDQSSVTFLEELADAVHQEHEVQGRHIYVIAENDRNDVRVVTPPEIGGQGCDAQWSDDLHHSLHALLTVENSGYYVDFGKLTHLSKALRDGFVYSGEYSPFRQRHHGTSSRHIPAYRLVVCAQNHDQVGNRILGERLSQLTDFEGLKLAAGVILLSPYIPLLFMGEEYGENHPFLYFTDHSDPGLVEGVRKGRREEFAAWGGEGESPDPQAERTFQQSKLDHAVKRKGHHVVLRRLHRDLLRLRNSLPALSNTNKERMEVISFEKSKVLFMRRWEDQCEVFTIFNFCGEATTICLPVPEGQWRKQFDTTAPRWRAGRPPAAYKKPTADLLVSDGELIVPLSPFSFVVYASDAWVLNPAHNAVESL
jgi:maltooligosyltrehalose trehalohydrolase